jgi:hypothetical protein
MALLACVLASTTLCAQGAGTASASASLSHFTFEIIDLAPQDGVAPQLLFYNRSVGAQSGLWQTWHGAYQGTLRDDYLYTDGTSRVQYDDNLATASAQLHVAGATALAGVDVGAIAISQVSEYYWLSPHTQLTVHWTAETNATASPDNIGRSSIELYSDIFVSAANIAESTNFTLSSNAADGIRSQPVTIQWSTGGQAATGTFRLRTEARVGPSITPIPETSTWAMLLAGALLISGAARAQSSKEKT